KSPRRCPVKFSSL
ncbi:hypothetical protein KKC1_17310, partial [Calderihabitans maritimus]